MTFMGISNSYSLAAHLGEFGDKLKVPQKEAFFVIRSWPSSIISAKERIPEDFHFIQFF